MINSTDLQLRQIRRALISVSDKSGIVDFAKQLKTFNVEIISTGGTAKTLREAGVEVRDISDLTGFPEMMDGRVKTLHPRVHGGLLAIRDNDEHTRSMSEHGIDPIDMVVVNLYPFEATIQRPGVTREEAIEQIDIGGPAMIRSAAKNAQDVAVVVLPDHYQQLISELEAQKGSLSHETRKMLAQAAFLHTANYDGIIAVYLAGAYENHQDHSRSIAMSAGGGTSSGSAIYSDVGPGDPDDDFLDTNLPASASLSFDKTQDLRYGENPHQKAALYITGDGGFADAALLSGKEMSFNNFVDADAAWQLVCDFDETACAIIKHTNPAGVGLGETTAEAYRKALVTDPVSAFGGIVSFNRPVDAEAATEVTKIFTEVVIAPGYSAEALEILQAKKNLRVLRMKSVEPVKGLEYRQIGGGFLIQTKDNHQLSEQDLKVVTNRQPTDDEVKALLFAWTVCKHTKSNAIVYARKDQTVGVGAGQMSRIDSVKIGAMRAQIPTENSVLASDAFFPFRDGLDEAAKYGITAVIQPGGSVRDEEVIVAANEYNLAMVFTGIRHFKH